MEILVGESVFLYVWCGNGVPTPLFLAIHSGTMTHKLSGVRVEEYAYYVNKLGNRNITSNCDVTKSEHQIQMTTICH